MPIKEKIEVEMLSPLMAEFIPDYSDIVDLDDAEPLEGPDLVQYQPSIAEKVDEINRLGMPDNQPCNLIDYFDRDKAIKEKVECITMAVKEQDKRLQDLGVQISNYRKQKKMTQAQLAVEIGISRTHMSNIEALNMPTQISVDTLFKIADVLGIKVSNLFEEI